MQLFGQSVNLENYFFAELVVSGKGGARPAIVYPKLWDDISEYFKFNILCIFSIHIFFIGNSIFHLSLELLTKFWKTSLKVA